MHQSRPSFRKPASRIPADIIHLDGEIWLSTIQDQGFCRAEVEDVERCSRVPPVLGHKPDEGFRPMVRGGWSRPASDSMSVQ
jgi:hypothetical protein